jgi:hypothetical protein
MSRKSRPHVRDFRDAHATCADVTQATETYQASMTLRLEMNETRVAVTDMQINSQKGATK